MKKVAKIVAVAAAITLVAASFSGCSKNKQQEVTTSKEEATKAPAEEEKKAEATPTEAPKEVSKVVFWTGNAHDKEFMADQTEKYNSTIGKDMGVEVEFQYIDGIDQKMDIAFTSNQAPDVFVGGMIPQNGADKGYIAAIDDLPGGPEFLQKYKDYTFEGSHMIKGKTYTVPYAATTYGLVYNKDMFVAAGIVDENGEAKPPVTWEEYLEDAKLLTNPDKNEYGICFPAKWGGFFGFDVNMATVGSYGFLNGYNPKTGKFDFSAWGDAMKIIMKAKESGYALPGADGLDNDPARARFAEGGIGMKSAASFDYGVYTEQFPAKINWGVCPFPTNDPDNCYKQFCDRGWYMFINKASVDKIGGEKLMSVYEYFNSDEILIESFKGGYNIPYNYDIVKDVEIDPSMENWKAFAQLANISITPSYTSPMTDIEGKKGIVDIFLQDIWPNDKITDEEIDKLVKQSEDDFNNGIEVYKKNNSDYVIPDSCYDPSYDPKR